jgi:hypothetical protein
MSDFLTKVISENYASYRSLVRGDADQLTTEILVRIDSHQVLFDEVKELHH